MDITPGQRNDRFETANSAIQHLYSSSESGEILESIFEKYNLDQKWYKSYALTVGHVILGFYPISSLAAQLQATISTGEHTAQSIASDLTEFLSPVLEQDYVFANAPGSIAVPLPSTPTPPIEKTDSEAPVAPSPAPPNETDSQGIEPVRTMEHDVDKIHGYDAYRDKHPDPNQAGSPDEEEIVQATSQEATLGERPELAKVPTYTENQSG